MKASIIEPEKAVRPVGRLKILFTRGTNVIIPIKPTTTLGIAAISSTKDFKISRILFGTISEINKAVITPIGTAITHAPMVTKTEPTINGKTPNEAEFDDGYQKCPPINFKTPKFLKKEKPSLNKKEKIKTTNIIDIIPHIKIIFSTIKSKTFFMPAFCLELFY
jgi:hypothetical protein